MFHPEVRSFLEHKRDSIPKGAKELRHEHNALTQALESGELNNVAQAKLEKEVAFLEHRLGIRQAELFVSHHPRLNGGVSDEEKIRKKETVHALSMRLHLFRTALGRA